MPWAGPEAGGSLEEAPDVVLEGAPGVPVVLEGPPGDVTEGAPGDAQEGAPGLVRWAGPEAGV